MQFITVLYPESKIFNPDLVTSDEDNILDQINDNQMFLCMWSADLNF